MSAPMVQEVPILCGFLGFGLGPIHVSILGGIPAIRRAIDRPGNHA